MLPNLSDSSTLVPPVLNGTVGIPSFYTHKTIEQIVQERQLKPVRWEDMFPEEPIWESEEKFDEFWNSDLNPSER